MVHLVEMNHDPHPSAPMWTSILGALSILPILEFWAHLLIPYLRNHVQYPWWPTSAVFVLLSSAVLAAIAAVRGLRVWWLSAAFALGALGFLLLVLGG